MSGATLVSTTRTDIRPMAWAGTPLHRHQAQIRAVVRRRLGERHFQLLSEPQPHDNDNTIDWYSGRRGRPQPLPTLSPAQRGQARSDIAAMLYDIDRLGQTLEDGPTEDCRLAGKLLRFAVHGPTDEHLFLVDDQPVIACWGYDFAGIGIMPAAPAVPAAVESPVADMPSPPPPAAVEAPAAVEMPPAVAIEAPAADEPQAAAPVTAAATPVEPVARRRRFGWLAWLGLLLVALALGVWLWDQREPPRRVEAISPPAAPVEVPVPSADSDPRTIGVAPPVTRPPRGMLACSRALSSGGGELTENRHYLGSKAGLVTITFDMFDAPDEMRVYYRGRLVATTERQVEGRGKVSFRYQPEPGFYSVQVQIIGSHETSEWDYTLGCPR